MLVLLIAPPFRGPFEIDAYLGYHGPFLFERMPDIQLGRLHAYGRNDVSPDKCLVSGGTDAGACQQQRKYENIPSHRFRQSYAPYFGLLQEAKKDSSDFFFF